MEVVVSAQRCAFFWMASTLPSVSHQGFCDTSNAEVIASLGQAIGDLKRLSTEGDLTPAIDQHPPNAVRQAFQDSRHRGHRHGRS
jgi:hypothetical protein